MQRPDIQALRGISVLSVILFHIDSGSFPNGYLGVDVFFVISGFVITPHILRMAGARPGLATTSEVLFEFYFRRVFRLLPALSVTILAGTLPILLVSDFESIRKYALLAISSIFGVANVGAYALAGDYFNHNSNPWIHLWSLSVEAQLYFFVPAMFMLCKLLSEKIKFKSKIAPWFFVTITISSYLFFIEPPQFIPTYSLLGINDPTNFNYYSPLNRAWEFCLGALLAVRGSNKGHKFFDTKAGLPLKILWFITIVYLLSSKSTLDRISITTIICILTIVGIQINAMQLLPPPMFRFLVWSGDRSYSIYLVHLPVIYLAASINYAENYNVIYGIVVISLIYVLGHQLFTRVEMRYRKIPLLGLPKSAELKKVLIKFFALPAIIVSASLLISANVTPLLIPKEFTPSYIDHVLFRDGCEGSKIQVDECLYPKEANSNLILLVGDSQAWANGDGILKSAADSNYSLLGLSANGCPFIGGTPGGPEYNDCSLHQKQIMEAIEVYRPKIVVVSNRTNAYVGKYSSQHRLKGDANQSTLNVRASISEYKRSITGVLKSLTEKGIKVILIQNIPEPKIWKTNSILNLITSRLARSTQSGYEDFNLDYEVRRTEKELLKMQNVYVFDPSTSLCNEVGCSLYQNYVPLYVDEWHLSVKGSLQLSFELTQLLAKVK